MITLAPMGGICNRLAAILSYRAKYGHIDCVWSHEFQVGGGKWADAFAPLDGVSFRPSHKVIHHEGGPTVVDGVTYDNHACLPIDPTWYRELLPATSVEPMRCETALHIRRTDLKDLGYVPGAPNYTSDASFLAFCAGYHGSVYIATDNHRTQEAFAAVLGTRATARIIPAHNELAHDQRATRIEHAAADLFSCALAQRFMGTVGSSFTYTIEILRSLRA